MELPSLSALPVPWASHFCHPVQPVKARGRKGSRSRAERLLKWRLSWFYFGGVRWRQLAKYVYKHWYIYIYTRGTQNLHFWGLWPIYWGPKTFIFHSFGVQRYTVYIMYKIILGLKQKNWLKCHHYLQCVLFFYNGFAGFHRNSWANRLESVPNLNHTSI